MMIITYQHMNKFSHIDTPGDINMVNYVYMGVVVLEHVFSRHTYFRYLDNVALTISFSISATAFVNMSPSCTIL